MEPDAYVAVEAEVVERHARRLMCAAAVSGARLGRRTGCPRPRAGGPSCRDLLQFLVEWPTSSQCRQREGLGQRGNMVEGQAIETTADEVRRNRTTRRGHRTPSGPMVTTKMAARDDQLKAVFVDQRRTSSGRARCRTDARTTRRQWGVGET